MRRGTIPELWNIFLVRGTPRLYTLLYKTSEKVYTCASCILRNHFCFKAFRILYIVKAGKRRVSPVH